MSYRLDTFTTMGAVGVTPTTNTNLLDPDWFRWLDPAEPHLILTPDVMISASPTEAISADKEIALIVFGGDF